MSADHCTLKEERSRGTCRDRGACRVGRGRNPVNRRPESRWERPSHREVSPGSLGWPWPQWHIAKDERWSHAVVVQLLSHVWLCNTMDCSPPGSSVHGILQARILEWVALPSSMGSSQPIGLPRVGNDLTTKQQQQFLCIKKIHYTDKPNYGLLIKHSSTYFLYLVLFIYLLDCLVLVAVHRIFSCSTWDLVEPPTPCIGSTES